MRKRKSSSLLLIIVAAVFLGQYHPLELKAVLIEQLKDYSF